MERVARSGQKQSYFCRSASAIFFCDAAAKISKNVLQELELAKSKLLDTEEELDREKQNAKYHHKNSKEMKEEIATHKREIVNSSIEQDHMPLVRS